MIHVSAPGKQMMVGEWAVLEVGNPSIVAAVNKRVHCTVEDFHNTGDKAVPNHSVISITIDDFNIKNIVAHFDGSRLLFKELSDYEKEKLQFFKEAIEVTMQYLAERVDQLKDFHIHSWGELSQISVDGQDKKIGFGSSAAATVAVTAAILAHHGFETEKMKEEIYKLSTMAHYFAQGKVGSAFDIASSCYGGLLVYKRFDPSWLLAEVQRDTIKGVVEKKWPALLLQELKIPKDFIFLVGWTKGSASTSAMIKQLDAFKNSRRSEYDDIMSSIGDLVSDMIEACNKNDKKKILELIRKNEKLLSHLTKESGVPIETENLKKLSELADKAGAAGKLSGAGGGDCGIAVCFDELIAKVVKESWRENDLYPLDVKIDRHGVMIKE
jgi:phosphomevalonate kinase